MQPQQQGQRFLQEHTLVKEEDGTALPGFMAAHNPTYYTVAEIDNSPTHQEGESAARVNSWRKTYTNMILAVCEKMRV